MLQNVNKEGNVVSLKARMIESVLCNEYSYTGEWENDQGQPVTGEVHLFAASDNGLPMYVKSKSSVQGTGITVTATWQLSHLNDPANIVESP